MLTLMFAVVFALLALLVFRSIWPALRTILVGIAEFCVALLRLCLMGIAAAATAQLIWMLLA